MKRKAPENLRSWEDIAELVQGVLNRQSCVIVAHYCVPKVVDLCRSHSSVSAQLEIHEIFTFPLLRPCVDGQPVTQVNVTSRKKSRSTERQISLYFEALGFRTFTLISIPTLVPLGIDQRPVEVFDLDTLTEKKRKIVGRMVGFLISSDSPKSNLKVIVDNEITRSMKDDAWMETLVDSRSETARSETPFLMLV